jgi:predicted kinase
LSATGKSTLAAALAAASGFPCINSDVVRKQRAGLRPTEPGPRHVYGSEASLATYAALGRRARTLAEGGVIVDATFRRRVDRDAFRSQMRPDVPMLVVECQAPQAVLEARARARSADPGAVSDAGVAVVRRQREDADPLDEVPPRVHLRLRSERPPPELVAAIADALDRRLVAPPARSGDAYAVGGRGPRPGLATLDGDPGHDRRALPGT